MRSGDSTSEDWDPLDPKDRDPIYRKGQENQLNSLALNIQISDPIQSHQEILWFPCP